MESFVLEFLKIKEADERTLNYGSIVREIDIKQVAAF
jgi:hypothetical protein